MRFEPLTDRSLSLRNRIMMAPTLRGRSLHEHIPDLSMVKYYSDRASAGLIVTEGTSPCPDGLGFSGMPGLYNSDQAAGWKAVVEAVHRRGGKIFLQLLHAGRVAHVNNLPRGARVMAPGSLICPGEITDRNGVTHSYSLPHEMTAADIERAVIRFAASARMAIDVGCDGVEIHGADGYLIDQFLNPRVNRRTDGYGSSVHGRNRFVLEVARAVTDAVGSDRVGIRLSPFGTCHGTGDFPAIREQFLELTDELSALELMYLHLIDHSATGSPIVPADFKAAMRARFDGLFVLSGGFSLASAEVALIDRRADLIAFGRTLIPDGRSAPRLTHGRVSATDQTHDRVLTSH